MLLSSYCFRFANSLYMNTGLNIQLRHSYTLSGRLFFTENANYVQNPEFIDKTKVLLYASIHLSSSSILVLVMNPVLPLLHPVFVDVCFPPESVQLQFTCLSVQTHKSIHEFKGTFVPHVIKLLPGVWDVALTRTGQTWGRSDFGLWTLTLVAHSPDAVAASKHLVLLLGSKPL